MDNPQSLLNLVKYQADSIVSREILKSNSGSVTVFAFDKDQGLSPHKTPYEALIYLLDGSAQITIADRVHTLAKGQSLTMPANQTHAVKALSKFKMLLIMLKV
jgi:quercetin dioxygenase-like cupin family protein